MEEPHDDARWQEAARVRGVRRGVRAQAVVGRAHQVRNHTEFAMHLVEVHGKLFRKAICSLALFSGVITSVKIHMPSHDVNQKVFARPLI